MIRNEENLVGGYYLSNPGYQDVAVLSIPSYVGDGSQEESFQDVVTTFLKQSKTDGKQKLIIDVSANAGKSQAHLSPLLLSLAQMSWHTDEWAAHQSTLALH